MSFWATTDGEKIVSKEKIEVDGGNMPPMPRDTQVKAAIEEAKWDTTDKDGTFISLKWTVLAPAMHKGRKVFQKLKVKAAEGKGSNNAGKEQSKLDKDQNKALRMFAVIDTNAGGKLLASPKAPDDQALTVNLVNKTMLLKLDIWEIQTDQNGNKITNPADYARGNWIKAVSPKGEYVEPSQDELEAAVKAQQQELARLAALPSNPAGGGGGNGGAADDFDDIPF
jgi:hypothetical protein